MAEHQPIPEPEQPGPASRADRGSSNEIGGSENGQPPLRRVVRVEVYYVDGSVDYLEGEAAEEFQELIQELITGSAYRASADSRLANLDWQHKPASLVEPNS